VSTDSTSCSLTHNGIQSCQATPAKSIEKNSIWQVIGDSKIYNFHIHRLMHFSTNFWRKSCSNSGSAKRCRPERAAPRRCARPHARFLGIRARAPPDAPPPKLACRPRPTRLPPGPRHAPRCLGLPTPRTSPSPHRTRAVHAADRRSVRGPAVHTLAEERRSTATS
jgi:hypothetical protein